MQTFNQKLAGAGTANLDVVQAVSKVFEISPEKAQDLCKRNKIPLKVESRAYVDKALKKLTEIMKAENENGKRKEQ